MNLKHLNKSNDNRIEIASHYSSQLTSMVKLPLEHKHIKHVFHLFVIQTDHRDELIQHLRKHDIIAGIHYPLPIHEQPAYMGQIKTHGNLTITSTVAKKCLSLPIYPGLSMTEVDKVIDTVNNFFQQPNGV